MKKCVLATTISLFFFIAGFAQTTDSVYSERKANGIWQKSELDIITRDASCSLVSMIALAWNESSQSWVNSRLTTYTYNNTGALIEVLTQSWDAISNTWINNSKKVTLYGNAGLNISYLLQTWDVSSNSWINNYRIVDQLDGLGMVITEEFDLYSDNVWLKIQRAQISYDGSNRTAEIVYQNWTDNLWINDSRTVYSYTGNGLSLDYVWNTDSKKWTKFRRTFNDYLGTTELVEKSFSEVGSGSAWVNSFRYNQTYTGNNLKHSGFKQFWNINTQSWINSFQEKLDYYATGSQHNYSFELWDANTSSWGYGYRSTSTNISCVQSLQLVAVSDLKNNTVALMQNKNRNYLMNRMQNVQTNNIQRSFNPLAGNRNSVVYDLTFNGGDPSQQYAFELILSTRELPQSVKNTGVDNAFATNKSSFMLSPNPAKTYFNINLSAWKNASNLVLKLSDITGKLMMQQKINEGTQRINLPALQKGVYLVTITSGKEIETQKLVIE